MGCCKVHKMTCQIQDITGNQISPNLILEDINFSTESENKIIKGANDSSSTSASSPISIASSTADLSSKLKSSLRLNIFFKSNPYLSEQLPVLLARIDRSNINNNNNNNSNTSQLTRDLEKKQNISELLKEAIETDPKISELYTILREEDLI